MSVHTQVQVAQSIQGCRRLLLDAQVASQEFTVTASRAAMETQGCCVAAMAQQPSPARC